MYTKEDIENMANLNSKGGDSKVNKPSINSIYDFIAISYCLMFICCGDVVQRKSKKPKAAAKKIDEEEIEL